MLINGFPNYHIFRNGAVLSEGNKFNKPRFLKQSLNTHLYYCVNLYKDGKQTPVRIHRLLGEHFIPKVEGKDMIDHKNQNKRDNRLCNLRWVNRSENAINTGHKITNKLGEKYICFDKNRNKYMFQIKRDGKKHLKRFKTLEEAIKYRTEYIP